MTGGPLFKRVALIGIGHLGSSIAHAIRKHGLADEIAASARTEATLETAKRLGIADVTDIDPAKAAAGADLVILCAPLGAYAGLAEAIGPALKAGAILTDIGSAKQCAVRDVAPHVPEGVHFIPSHPVAGQEHSGPESGFAELFEDRFCVMTPLPDSDPAVIDRLVRFWKGCGMDVEFMDPAHHDLVLALTSHLPHLIAYSIVGTADDLETDLKSEVIRYSAGGFRDFTRIAGSNPVMWRDIFLNNREAVLEVLGRFNEDLSALQRAVRRGDGQALEDFFTRTRDIRRKVVAAKQA